MKKEKITFEKIPSNLSNEDQINKLYYVVDNERSEFLENFDNLDKNTKRKIRQLFERMAKYENFTNPSMITYPLKKYAYGEIRPKPHRFFYFRKCGKNLIFFAYCLKKKNKLKDEYYKSVDEKRKKYEKAFERFTREIQ
ncbi:MAG: hypothetical protein PHX07_07390 [Candidatus Marinimicrobia bacterium]|nr:hypothetical protein [Candidatus Neomarinimicrobiota bacterium]MDX9815791.1 hypothetical protein [Smithellaceae bacterium]